MYIACACMLVVQISVFYISITVLLAFNFVPLLET